MKHAALALVLIAGCHAKGQSVHPPPYPMDPIGPEGTDVNVDPAIYDGVKTSELGTEKVRPIAKTIEWPAISTSEGDSFVSDAVVVDQIFREDADNMYGVRVRLKNAGAETLSLEYLIRFHTRAGANLASHNGDWKPFLLEPFKTETVGDFALILGAEGFRLFVRPAGGGADGAPDDPARKEERKRAREAAEAQKK